ncbi:hypothetical protein [Corynebacterium sp. H113]|uniref:hypothetical protein n=1 Tax=Corynebacterium sp. H113 TaxID=3133419 RepID=UPI0030B51F29
MKWLSLATVIAAAGSFVILFLSAKTLNLDVNAQFVAYWGMFFALTGVLGGLMQETTRAVGAADAGHDVSGQAGARPITVAVGVSVVTFVVLAATGFLWAPQIMDGHTCADQTIGTVLMAGGLGLYAMQAATSGLLSASKLWGQYATLIIIDILIRVVPAVLAYVFQWSLLAWLVITVIGAMSWLGLVAFSPATRRALTKRADVPLRRFIPLMITAMWASGASAVLVTGFPTLVKLADDYATTAQGPLSGELGITAGGVTAAAVAYAVTLTRAPLLMPLEKFQNAIIVHFVQRDGGPLSALAKPLGALIAFGTCGAGLAWLIGPWLMVTILGDEYFVAGHTLAALTLAATATAVLMITGSVTLAVEQHRMYMAGWLSATLVAVVILFIPGLLEVRTSAALLLGSIVGIVIHLWTLKTGDYSSSQSKHRQADLESNA